jgi:hypothetical protein
MGGGIMKAIKLMILGILGVSLTLVSVVSAADWYVPADFATIQVAIDSSSVGNGDRIFVGPGNHAGALVTKGVEIKGEGGATINSGPPHSSGFIMGFRLMGGSEGATISHLRFEVDLAIMNGAAINNVTVTHCTFANTVQAISNWLGSSWNITHNEIIDLRTRNGGGIGILVGDYLGGIVTDNVIAHNKISGTFTSMEGEQGGYNGSGIVLYADFRWGRLGTQSLSFNRVVKNKVSLTSASALVDVVAFEMTDTRGDSSIIPPVIYNNSVGFNDFRGTAVQVDLTPDNLDEFNFISRNLGENRGHGLHPSAFHPD